MNFTPAVDGQPYFASDYNALRTTVEGHDDRLLLLEGSSLALVSSAATANANSTTPVQIASGTFTAQTGTRRVSVTAQCSIQSTVATDLPRVTINIDGSEVARYQLVPGAAGGAGQAFGTAFGWTSLAGGSHTWTATVLRAIGTGTVTGGLSSLRLRDEGV